MNITPNDFLVRLEQRMTLYNARLLLNSAMVESGISQSVDVALEPDQVKILCLGLIKKGGPAFHVGQAIYRESIQ